MITRTFEIAILVLLATIILMPRPDVTIKPALQLPRERRERAAELEAELAASPAAVEPALELANLFIDAHRPDWSLAVLAGPLAARPADYRVHHVRALAFAERFESAPANEAAKKALFLCENPPREGAVPCDDAAHARLGLLARTTAGIAGIDMRKDPNAAKERILKELRPAWIPLPKPGKPVVKPPAKP